MNPRLLTSFRHTALAAAVSTLYLAPVLTAQAADPGPIGSEFGVNTLTLGNQITPAVARDADGDFVVVWESNIAGSYEIRARRYSAAGQALSGEFQVNSTTANNQRNPRIAMDADGDFVVAWDSATVASSDYDIRAQRYNAAGLAQGGEFQVNTLTTGNQRAPVVALDADGDFVVAWQGNVPGNGYNIRAQRYNASGAALGAEFQINSLTGGNDVAPAIAIDADGDFAVSWTAYVTGNSFEVRARRYNGTGVAQGAEFTVNTVKPGGQFDSSVAMAAGGDFVVVWNGPVSGFFEIRGQRYNAAGIAQGTEIAVSPMNTDSKFSPTVSMDAVGDFVVAWETDATGLAKEIRAQRFNAAGLAQGGELAVNNVTASNQTLPAVATDADGDFVVAWASYGAPEGNEIRARRFQGADPVDIGLTQTDSADPAPAGVPLSYSLSVSNRRASTSLTGVAAIDSAIGTATSLRLVDTLPKGSKNVSFSGSNWTCTAPAAQMTCDYSLPLPAAATASPLTITLRPPNKPGKSLKNVGSVSADPLDDRPENNSDTEKTLLQ